MDNATPKLADRLLIGISMLEDDARIMTEGMARVRAYRSFLAGARAAKAAGSVDIDAQVLARARHVRRQSQDLLEAGARTVRALHLGGAVANLTDIIARSVKSGPVALADLWSRLDNSCESCVGMGFDPDLLDEFRQAFGHADLALVESTDGPRVRGKFGERSIDLPIRATPRDSRLPANVPALLASGRLLALCDAIEDGEPAYLLGVGCAADHPTVDEAMMLDLLAGQREMIRHVRKLEDIGLSTRTGEDPATVATIAIIIAVVGVITMLIECPDGTQSINDAANSDDAGCAAGAFLATLGIASLLVLSHYHQPPMSTTGQNISGPLPQLQG